MKPRYWQDEAQSAESQKAKSRERRFDGNQRESIFKQSQHEETAELATDNAQASSHNLIAKYKSKKVQQATRDSRRKLAVEDEIVDEDLEMHVEEKHEMSSHLCQAQLQL